MRAGVLTRVRGIDSHVVNVALSNDSSFCASRNNRSDAKRVCEGPTLFDLSTWRKAAAAGAIGLCAPIDPTRAGAALRQRKAAAPARAGVTGTTRMVVQEAAAVAEAPGVARKWPCGSSEARGRACPAYKSGLR
jgi:hypothetical protein